jgi:catechol 2,3-dioxygenase-like lactoylglutathione lyase family enzyme
MINLDLKMVTLLVPDYDPAIAFYTNGLGFDLIEDTAVSDTKRWVVVGGAGGARLLLAKATTAEQRAAVGKLAGDRVAFFLHTDDFDATHAALGTFGAVFEEAPREEAYGKIAVFRDPFGNRWDLIESKA